MYLEKDQIDTLIFDARYGDGEYVNYEDDGESLSYLDGYYNLYKVSINGDDISLEVLKNDYNSPYKKIIVITSNIIKEFEI